MLIRTVSVPYVQPPITELATLFDRVWEEYEGLLFLPAEPCKDVVSSPQERTFDLYVLPDDMTNEDIIDQLRVSRQRPAIYEEGIAFAAAYPDVQLRSPYVAIGSTAMAKVDADDPVVRLTIEQEMITLDGDKIRVFADFSRSGPRRELGLLFDIGFLDEGTTVLAVQE